MSRKDFGWDYPPGVTGSEFAIARPDYERETDELCSSCSGAMLELGYRGNRWLVCQWCGQTDDLGRDDEPDPDRKHDEAVERRLFGGDDA